MDGFEARYGPRASTAEGAHLQPLLQAVLGVVCARDRHEVFRHTCEGAQLLSGADVTVVLQARRGELVEALSVPGTCSCGWLVQQLTENPLSAAHLAWSTRRRQERTVIAPLSCAPAGTRWAVLVEPLCDEDVVHALLVLVWRGSDDRPLPALTPLLGAAAGTALSRVGELRLLRSGATGDPRTGLAPGPTFRQIATRALTRAAHSLRPVSLLMACVQPATGSSWREGSAAGHPEAVLAVQRWRSVRRPLDLLARYDGEAYAVLLPEVDAQQAQQICRRLTEACPRQVSAVFGVATAVCDPRLDVLVDAAMHALSVRRRRESV